MLNKDIDKRHPEVEENAPLWEKVRDAVDGEHEIHEAGTRYLPRLKDESRADYEARVNRTPWYNASWRTISALHGMLFRKDPTITVPAGIEAMLDDVTLTGVPFVNFLKELGHEVLGPGVAGILIDHPPAPDLGGAPLTVSIAEKMGLRPTMALYKCETFINWKFRRINNKWVLSQLRLKECHTKDVSEFEQAEVEKIRVLDLNPEAGDSYRIRFYLKNEKTGEWEQDGPEMVPVLNGKPLDFIPFIFVTANGVVAEIEEPPLIDLVDLNLKHYQVSADYEHACHFTALPTPWVTGLSAQIDPETGKEIPQKLYIGSTTAWVFQNVDAKVGFLEFTGQGIDALKANLESKENQMAAIGARMLAPEKSAAEAAATLAMRHSGEQSVLSSIANSLSMAATMALRWFSLWANKAGEVDAKVNRDFMPVSMDSATLTALVEAWQSGAISEEELFAELQRGDVVRPEKTYEEHKAELENNPPMGVMASAAAIEAMQNPDPATQQQDQQQPQ